jgi:hypothetical protein
LNENDIVRLFNIDESIKINIPENYMIKLLYHSNKLLENKYYDANILSKGEYNVDRMINNNVLEK